MCLRSGEGNEILFAHHRLNAHLSLQVIVSLVATALTSGVCKPERDIYFGHIVDNILRYAPPLPALPPPKISQIKERI